MVMSRSYPYNPGKSLTIQHHCLEATTKLLGPSPQQIADQLLGQDEPIEPCFGICTECNANKPKQKDKSVVDALISAEMQGKLLTIDSDGSAVHFPYVLSDPVCK
jgi:hypothetical protein